ncbi:hypothetical protein ACRQ4B_17260 [Curtobacterium sp. SP.BCo]|uniref:hypothetical protein n=1 Tax=Curtobacterium sp. SP.BCo TaxID=3435229 RepID=UPI003F733B78
MGNGWKVDIAGSEAIVRDTAKAGSAMQDAASDVDAALRDVVAALAGSDAAGDAQGFLAAHQGEATTAVRAVEKAITGATGAMNAFADADATMAERATASTPRGFGRSVQ